MPDLELDEVVGLDRQLTEDEKLLHALRRLGASRAADELQRLVDESKAIRAELVSSLPFRLA